MPVSYLGTQGILNGLNVGDPFFAKLGATVTERTYCDSGSCTAYAMTIGDTAGVDPESLVNSKFILVWACNILSTNLHLWPYVIEAQQARREGRRRRPGEDPHRRPGRPAHRDPPRHRRRPGPGHVPRDHHREPRRPGLRRQLHRRLPRVRRARGAVHAGMGRGRVRRRRRRHPHPRPRVRRRPAVAHPDRCRRRAARRRRTDSKDTRHPPGARRRLAQARRRDPAAAAVGVPGELAGVPAPGAADPGQARREPVPARRRPHRRPGSGPADQVLVRLQLQPGRRLSRPGEADRGTASATTCSWSSASSS